jgi:hypothetical protein
VPEAGPVVLRETMSPAAVTASRARAARRRRPKARSATRRPKARSATWGNRCSSGAGETYDHHCYALADWHMHSSEYVEGAGALEYTNSMNVPYWEDGDFVTNEQWVLFTHGRWVEMGSEGGYGGCCGLEAFKAEKSAERGEYREAALGAASFRQWIAYSMDSEASGNWCFYIGNNKELGEACSAVMERYSKELEVGEEAADEITPETRARSRPPRSSAMVTGIIGISPKISWRTKRGA